MTLNRHCEFSLDRRPTSLNETAARAPAPSSGRAGVGARGPKSKKAHWALLAFRFRAGRAKGANRFGKARLPHLISPRVGG